MKIAIVQCGYLAQKSVENFLKYQQKGTIVVFPEYAFDAFFAPDPKNDYQKNLIFLKNAAKIYSLSIIAPLIVPDPKREGFVKKIAHIMPTKTTFYEQQRLINFQHWDEKNFFKNTFDALQDPMIFRKNGIKFGVIFGFEMHYDELFVRMQNSGVQIVLIPCASAFASHDRWLMIAKTRALCNGMMIVRANKIGKFEIDGRAHEFYGKSFVINADGSVFEEMDTKESVLAFDITKKQLDTAAAEWNFAQKAELDPKKSKKTAPKGGKNEK